MSDVDYNNIPVGLPWHAVADIMYIWQQMPGNVYYWSDEAIPCAQYVLGFITYIEEHNSLTNHKYSNEFICPSAAERVESGGAEEKPGGGKKAEITGELSQAITLHCHFHNHSLTLYSLPS